MSPSNVNKKGRKQNTSQLKKYQLKTRKQRYYKLIKMLFTSARAQPLTSKR
jgi:hypothetical protein